MRKKSEEARQGGMERSEGDGHAARMLSPEQRRDTRRHVQVEEAKYIEISVSTRVLFPISSSSSSSSSSSRSLLASVSQLRDSRQRDGGGPPSASVGIPRKKKEHSPPRAYNGSLAVLLSARNHFFAARRRLLPSRRVVLPLMVFPPTNEIPFPESTLCSQVI